MRYLVFIVFLLLCSSGIQAHEPDTINAKSHYRKSLTVGYQFGKVIHTHAFVKGDNPNGTSYQNFQAFSAQYGINTDGRKLWQQLYGYPVWGFGIFKGYLLGDDGLLGNPTAIYAYFRAPFKRWEKWVLEYEVDFGLATNWNSHDIIEKGYYYPIGSYSTAFFAFSFGAGFQIDRQLDISTRFSATHFSNGAIRLPNLGINLASAQLSLHYIFRERPVFKSSEVPKYQDNWEWIMLIAPAVKQKAADYNINDSTIAAKSFSYPVVTLSSTVNRQFTHMIKFGAGIDITYNATYGAEIIMVDNEPQKGDPLPFTDQLLVGVYPSFELVVNDLSMVVQSGFYIYRKDIEDLESPYSYQRLGIKYHILKRMFLGVNVRAYDFKKADFVEWVVGYRLRWRNN
jgi:hypothetical protein